MSIIFSYPEDYCYCDLPTFYNKIGCHIIDLAEDDGFLGDEAKKFSRLVTRNDHPRYDCRHISVSPVIRDYIYRYYEKELGYPEYQVAMLWLDAGPKVRDNLLEQRDKNFSFVEIEDGFIV